MLAEYRADSVGAVDVRSGHQGRGACGLASVVALTSAAACREIGSISVHHAVDGTPYASPESPVGA
jgi:hypothetical protein